MQIAVKSALFARERADYKVDPPSIK